MRKLLAAFVCAVTIIAALGGAPKEAMAANGVGSGTAPALIQNWQLSYSSTVALTAATVTVVPMDTKDADVAGVCDITTNKGRCTPTIPGTYLMTCSVSITDTTGPVVDGTVASAFLRKNGNTTVKFGAVYAQVASLPSFNAVASVTALVAVNGTTDFFECAGFSAVAGNLGNSQAISTFFNAVRVGP